MLRYRSPLHWVEVFRSYYGPLHHTFALLDTARQAALTAELGLTFVDLTPALRAAAAELKDRDLLYIPENLHLLAAGHRVIAQALA